MRVHHLNCGCMCPWGGPIWDGVSRGPTGRLICHCLLVEADDGLVLVDTGFGTGDMERPYQRLSPLFIHLNRIQFERRYTALEQVRSLGFSPRDVRHIVLTHLDFDHAGGLDDFPDATVHVMRAEMDQAEDRDGFIARNRYRPQQWDRVRNWRFYDVSRGERWFGFEAVRNLDGLPPEILMIPLPGHTWGHCGIAIDTPDGWLLDAADTYFYRHEIDRPERQAPVGPRAYQRLMATDYDLHMENQERVRGLSRDRDAGVRIFCSHDPVEFAALAALEPGR